MFSARPAEVAYSWCVMPKQGFGKDRLYTIGEVSFGLQIVGNASQVIMLAMTDRGVNALLSPSVKLGADVGVVAGPVGLALPASANISADILVYALSEGLYAGFHWTGAVVGVRNSWNEAYYGKKGVTPTDILIRGDVKNLASDKLLESVTKAAKPKMAETGAEMKPVSMSEGNHYTVQAGDSLSKIAAKHGTTVAQLVALNNLKDKKYIYPGQKLLFLRPSNMGTRTAQEFHAGTSGVRSPSP